MDLISMCPRLHWKNKQTLGDTILAMHTPSHINHNPPNTTVVCGTHSFSQYMVTFISSALAVTSETSVCMYTFVRDHR